MIEPRIALMVGTAALALALLIGWPGRGLWARWQAARRITTRVLTEDALKHLHKCEMHGQTPTLQSLAAALQLSSDRTAELLAHMQARGLVQPASQDYALTAQGREAALHIIRAHRLWERYLADETGYGEPEWHGQAERLEHHLQPGDVEALAMQLGNPTHDPHGDPIPDAAGNYVYHKGRPLTTLAAATSARIVHIEDEPEPVYAQLVAQGLYPGMDVRLLEASPTRVRFWAGGNEHVLAPLLAANISVRPLDEIAASAAEAPSEPVDTLAVLRPGEQGQVVGLSARCRGAERRRMMDLGILPGAVIGAELVSPGGDPTAYRIRGAMIALRREQAQLIAIQRLGEALA